MKRIGVLFGLLLLGACMVWAQDNNANSNANGNSSNHSNSQAAQSGTLGADDNSAAPGSTTASSSTTTDNSAQSQTEVSTTEARKRAAVHAENAADEAKQQAKDSGSAEGAEHDKAVARLDDAAKDLNQLLAAPDNGIPEEVYDKAKCIAVVPSMIKGGFIFGAEHGRGVASCRLAKGDWSAPAFFTMTGGSWGAQIGAEGVDLVMLIMNDNGMNQLLSAKFKVGGALSASAGPVGRHATADTSWKMNAEVLTYSRSRGLFAGATLNGTTIKNDEDAMLAYYHRNVGFRPALTGEARDPAGSKDLFTAALHHTRAEVNAQAH